MKPLLLAIISTFFLQIAFSQTTYTFTGNGFWTTATNWSNNTVPPALLPSGDIINVNPAQGDSCVLNTTQTISAGASLNIFSGAIFIVNESVTITGSLPVVRTDTIQYISRTSANSGVTIIANGGSPIVVKGLVWDTLQNPTINLSTKTIITDTLGNWIMGLQPGRTYYVRAYATNSVGTGYGNMRSFTTAPVFTNGDSSFIDPRDGQSYTFKHIGNQVWMTQNLNYVTDSSWCHSNNSDNCNVYGRLYYWNDALIAPPPGWHLPSDDEWQNLANHLGGKTVAGGAIKSTSDLWLYPNNGATNSSGFSGLPAGMLTSGMIFLDLGRATYWWTSTEIDSNLSTNRSIYYALTSLDGNTQGKKKGLSVRCVRDDTSFPSVSTDSVINITDSSAIAGGIVTSNGGSSIIATGLVWDTIPNPTVSLFTKTVNSIINDTFSNNIRSLLSHETYYVRAYATNSLGTSYGENRMFTTTLDSTFIDTRDGQVYTIKRIGTQVWMTQNLNYVTPSGSWCYDTSQANCDIYGRLYNWNTAKTVAPAGWHLPSSTELQTLASYLGGTNLAGGALKATSFWNSPNIGATNSSFFTGLPGGYNSNGSAFSGKGNFGYWWSSSPASAGDASSFQLSTNSAKMLIAGNSPSNGFSVRCIRN